MVARGDLGVEIGDEELPGLQKRIIRTALKHNRVVATATQMMQSMIENPVPTRAEVLDVANAVIDGTDAVMLSAETAVGKYPVRVIEAMNRICLGAERHFAAGRCRDPVECQVPEDRPGHRDGRDVHGHQSFGAGDRRPDRIGIHSTMAFAGALRGSDLSLFHQRPAVAAGWRCIATSTRCTLTAAAPTATRSSMTHCRNSGASARYTAGDRVIVTMGDQTGRSGGTNTLRLIKLDNEGGSESETRLDLG